MSANLLVRRAPSVFILFALLTGLSLAHGQTLDDESARRSALALLDSLWTARAWPAYHATLDSLETSPLTADGKFAAELLVRRGSQWVSFGEGQRAEPVLREALRLARSVGDTLLQCQATRWLSVAVGLQGRREEACDLYRQLQELASAAGDLAHEGWALVGFAWAAAEEGRAADAARDYRRASDLFLAAGDANGEIWALNGLGMALGRLGDHAAAMASYERVVERADAAGYQMAEAFGLNNLGHYEYLLGDPSVAVGHFSRALELQREIGQRREAIVPATNLALARIDLGQLNAAESLLDSVLTICEEQGYADFQGMVLNELARLSMARQRPREAIVRWRRALGLASSLSADLQARCLVGLSDALADVDSTAAATRVIEEGARRLQGLDLGEMNAWLRLTWGRRHLEANQVEAALGQLTEVAAQTEQVGWRILEVEALVLMARCQVALGEPDSALASLREGVAAWERDRSLPLAPEWREQRGAAGRALFTDLAALLLSRRDDGEGADARDDPARRAFAALQAYKARTLRERMLGPGHTWADSVGAGGSPGPASIETGSVSLSELQGSILQPGEVFLDTYLGPRTSVVFAVTRETCRAVLWPPANELEPRLRLYYELLSTVPDSPDSGWRKASASLGRLLLTGLADLLAGAERVIIAPDGVLNLLPLGELPPPLSLDEGEAGGRTGSGIPPAPTAAGVAPDRRVWTRVPAAAILADLRRAPGRPRPDRPRILAVCGNDPQRDLPGARREVSDLIARYRGVSIWPEAAGPGAAEPADLASAAASRLGTLARFGGFDLLHVAAHVHGDDQRPWHSEIRIWPAGSGGNPTAGAVAAMKLDTRVVVLASCASAGSRALSGEGLQGLGSAFLASGAEAVVATLWPVEDEATARFSRSFYGSLGRGATVAAAVRDAQDDLRGRPTTQHPFYWAGFVVLGDGDVTLPLQRRVPVSWLVAGGGLALLAIGLAIRAWARAGWGMIKGLYR
jgi:tetratricopeptide (TPR) repeat protein